MTKSNSVSSSMIFKTMERYSVMFIQMVVQIVIARILSPSHYGIVAMMTVFINIANVFIQSGFNSALIQKKDASELDKRTALTINFLVGVFMYALIFLAAPFIANFYREEAIVSCIRVLGLLLVFGSINSIQVAIANRNMQFGTLFKCNLIVSILSGGVGVVCAVIGLGVWALIIQQLSSCIILTIMLVSTLQWRPRFGYSKESAKNMFSFGWKMLAAALINVVFKELNGLIIGRKYTSSDLAFYTKGSYFPKAISSGLDMSISTVMFSAFSRKQENRNELHILFKKTINVNSYLLFMILGIFAVIAPSFISIILTDKWLPMVPYVWIACCTCVFHPAATAQLQALAAIGRSDLRLKMEFLKKSIVIALLIPAIPYGPLAIAVSAAISTLIAMLIGAVACQKYVGYSIVSTMKDILPIVAVTILTVVPLYFIGKIEMFPLWKMLVQSLAGLTIYIFLSALFGLYGYNYMKQFVLGKIKKKE